MRFAWSLAAFALACGASPNSPTRTSTEAPAPLRPGPLTGYIPAAGLRWLVVAHPRAVLNEPSWQEAARHLVSDERLDDFARASGIDLRRTREAIVAGYALGVLYAVRSDGAAVHAEERFAARSLHGVKVDRPHPDLTRVSGVIGATPQTLLRIGSDIVAIGVGDPMPIRAAEAFALGRLKRSVPVFRGAALAGLAEYEADAPFRFFALGPFDEPWESAALGLLGAASAVGVAARPAGGERLRARLHIAGDFANTNDHDTPLSRLARAWHAVSESSFGRLLGLDETVEPPRLAATEGGLSLDVAFEVMPLARGLHAATAGGVKEILGGLEPTPSSPGPAVEPPSKP
ncbi:MAG TPA: hypothetical protein VF989_07875 [Polyangiaceae bacterium]|jgi:hypothetical protein